MGLAAMKSRLDPPYVAGCTAVQTPEDGVRPTAWAGCNRLCGHNEEILHNLPRPLGGGDGARTSDCLFLHGMWGMAGEPSDPSSGRPPIPSTASPYCSLALSMTTSGLMKMLPANRDLGARIARYTVCAANESQTDPPRRRSRDSIRNDAGPFSMITGLLPWVDFGITLPELWGVFGQRKNPDGPDLLTEERPEVLPIAGQSLTAGKSRSQLSRTW